MMLTVVISVLFLSRWYESEKSPKSVNSVGIQGGWGKKGLRSAGERHHGAGKKSFCWGEKKGVLRSEMVHRHKYCFTELWGARPAGLGASPKNDLGRGNPRGPSGIILP